MAEFINNVKFPVINSNILVGETKLKEIVKPYFIMEKYNLGVIGYITKETPKLVSKGFTEGLTFYDPVEPVQKAIDELKAKGITRIICVSHNGYLEDMELARKTNGIHVIVGGHSHSLLSNDETLDPEGPYPTKVMNLGNEATFVVQAHRYGDYLGHLELEWDEANKLKSIDGAPILLDQKVPVERELFTLVNDWAKDFKKFDEDIVTVATEDFDGNCKFEVCPLAELLASCLASERRANGFDVDIGFFNGGGIRAGLQKGDISVSDVMSMLPFNNEGTYFSYSGAELADLIERSQSLTGAVPDISGDLIMGSLPQFSGVSFTVDKAKPPMSRTSDIKVNGEPIDMKRVYHIATIDFTTTGGDNILKPIKNVASNGDLMSDTVISCFRKLPSITPSFAQDSKITVLNKKLNLAAKKKLEHKERNSLKKDKK